MFDCHYDLLTYILMKKNDVNFLKNYCSKVYNESNITGGIFNLFYMTPKEMKEEIGIEENEINPIKNLAEVKQFIESNNLILKDINYIFGIEGLDYLQNIDDIDISALIEENISAILNSLGGSLGDLPEELVELIKNLKIDEYFPIKSLIKTGAIENEYTYQSIEDGEVKYYINRPVAWYGGGFSGSTVINEISENDYYSYAEPLDIDFAKETFSRAIGGIDTSDLVGTFQTIINLLSRCIVMAIGSHPFRFMTNDQVINNEKPILFDEVPSYLDLSSRTVR